MDRDHQHLELLSIVHYVGAGLVTLFSGLFMFQFLVGVALATGRLPDMETPEPFPGGLVMAISGCFILGAWAWAVALWVAGRSLVRKRRYPFCVATAAVSCFFFPFGTALGVLTLVVLMRPSVRVLFEPAP